MDIEEGNNWMDRYGEFITRLMQVKDGVISITAEVPGQDTPAPYTDESGFRNFTTDVELGDDYEQITVRIPSRLYEEEAEFSRKLWAIYAFMNEFKPWLMWNDDPSRLTMVRPLPGREWGDYNKVAIAQNAPKLPKRLNVFSQPTAIHKLYTDTTIIPDGESDVPHDVDTLTIQYLDDPADKKMTLAIDGKFRIRRSVINQLIDEYEERTENEGQAAQFRKKDRWNARLLFQLTGLPVLGKGDIIVCNDDVMAADVVVHDSNVKKEIGSTGNHAVIQMFPQEQADRAESDRQSISNFSTSALTPEILKAALTGQTDATIERFKEGYLPFDVPTEDRDNRGRIVIGAPLRAIFNKINAVLSMGGNLNDSPYLMKMAMGQISKMMGDMSDLSNADHDRKFPIPNAKRVSLANVLDIEWARGKKVHLKKNVAFIDPKLGLIMSVDTYADVAPVLGGADGDDHVVVIKMIAGFTDDYFGFTSGDTIYFVYRPPIGNGSDGERVASEFWIFKAKEQTPNDYMELNVLESRPVCVSELGKVKYTWFGGTKDLEGDEYSSRQAWKNFLQATDMTGSFGLYCNLLMVMVHHQIPFTPDAPMETYVDEAQQTMSKSGMDHISATTSLLKGIIEESGAPLDHYEAVRIGSEMPTMNGLFTELVTYHLGEQRRFLDAAREHIISRTLELKEANEGAKVDWMVRIDSRFKPGIISMINQAESKFKQKQGRNPSRHMDFEKIGTYVVNWMGMLIKAGQKMTVNDEEVALTEEMFSEHLRQAWKWSLADATVKTTGNLPIDKAVICNDRRLLMGSLLDRTMEALSEEES